MNEGFDHLSYVMGCLPLCDAGAVESELLHTYSQVDPLDVLVLCVRLAVLVAVTLTVPVVLFPVRTFTTVRLLSRFPFRSFKFNAQSRCD